MLLVQMSDLHVLAPGRQLSGIVDTGRLLAEAVAAVRALDPQPDAILLSGDLVDTGQAEEYQHLRQLLAPLNLPVYVIPGNHDAIANLRDAFADHPYLPAHGRLNWVVEDFPVRLIGLDSSVAGHSDGCLGDETLRWLDDTLAAAPDRPTLVALHHPPFPTGIRHMDRIGLQDANALRAVISRHPQVERLLSGHVHRAVQTRFAGTLASACPSTAHQIEFNLNDQHRGGFIMEPPAFQVHAWTAAAGLVSHLVPVGHFSGPHRFN